MNYRTDLALEAVENVKESGVDPGEKDGVILHQEIFDEDIKITTVTIVDQQGEALLGKPCGKYITIEVGGIMEEKKEIIHRASKAVARELHKLIPFDYYLKVLVVGLGNEKITPDALGPHTVSKVRITSHLFKIYQCDGDDEMANVSGLVPGVTATTGLETADLIKNAVNMTNPDVVVAIDSLAARNIDRVSTTIQISDTGISPGAGMGNMRKQLNESTLGTKVIAIGVPTVIDSKTLIMEAMEGADVAEDTMNAYFETKDFDMVVTSTDIDMVIKSFSDIIAKGINITLHPGIYS